MNEQHTKEHTPEPWEVIENDGAYVKDNSMAKFRIETSLESGRDLCVALVVTDCPDLDNKANARRIVACVNACFQLSTEDLERFGLAGAKGNWYSNTVDENKALRARVAVLEGALEGLLGQCEQGAAYHGITIDSHSAQTAINEARAALQNNGVSHE